VLFPLFFSNLVAHPVGQSCFAHALGQVESEASARELTRTEESFCSWKSQT